LVLISSIRAQTGISAEDVVTEATEPRPTDPYGRSKLEAEAVLRLSGLPHVTLRFVRIYGPGVKGHIVTLMRLAQSPWPLPFGSFRTRRSLLALENAISAVHFALDHEEVTGETYVVADPDPLTLPEIMAVLRSAIGRRPDVFPLPQAVLGGLMRVAGRADLWQPLTQSLIVSPAKLLAAGWQPPVGTRTALATLMRAERGRFAAI
jgi:UDP-glucose 4-epimerase